MNRDIQGKFALSYEDYRLVRSLRLTDFTWRALGVAAECLGMTRADYLEQIVRNNALPSITWKEEEELPCNTRLNVEKQPSITRYKKHSLDEDAGLMERVAIALPLVVDLEVLRDRLLFELKLGKQAPGYKAAQKALNRFIAELTSTK